MERVTDDRYSIVRPKFFHHPGAVFVDDLCVDAEQAGDFLGAMAFGDQLAHLALARGEFVRCRWALAPREVLVGDCAERRAARKQSGFVKA